MAKRSKGKNARFTRFESDFGMSIPVGPGVLELVDTLSELSRMKKIAVNAMMEEMWHRTNHEALGEPDPDCYLCSWAYKFSRFFHEAWYWQRLCDGCDRFQWHCNCEPECEC